MILSFCRLGNNVIYICYDRFCKFDYNIIYIKVIWFFVDLVIMWFVMIWEFVVFEGLVIMWFMCKLWVSFCRLV